MSNKNNLITSLDPARLLRFRYALSWSRSIDLHHHGDRLTPKDGRDRGLGYAYSRDHRLATLTQMIWAKRRPAVFQELSFSYAVLPTTQLKSVLIRIIFLRSNTFLMKPGSTGVLKDFFFFFLMKGKKQHELHFQQFGARVYFLVFTFPEEHSLSIIQLPDKQHKKCLDLRFVFFVQTEWFCICHQRGEFVCLAWGKL